ncbi:hypothetical protein ACIQ6K_07150 [Streptomyces sp. NPDC096354]
MTRPLNGWPGADRPRALRVAAERLLRAHVRAAVRQRCPAG